MSDYTPNNNPYIPGDPYSYDLKWMVNDIKHMENRFAELDDDIEFVTAEADRSRDEADRSDAEALKSEGYAKGTQDGEPVDPDSHYYNNNAEYFKNEAANEVLNAEAEALKSEGYASGEQEGTPVGPGSPYYENSSKFYRDEAQNIVDHIADPISGIVVSWLNDNITQPTTPIVDDSLTISTAAADAEVTGNAVRTAETGLFSALDLVPYETLNGALKHDGTLLNTNTAHYRKCVVPSGCEYITLLGSLAYTANIFSAVWFVEAGAMASDIQVVSNPQYFNYEKIAVPAGTEEIWISEDILAFNNNNEMVKKISDNLLNVEAPAPVDVEPGFMRSDGEIVMRTSNGRIYKYKNNGYTKLLLNGSGLMSIGSPVFSYIWFMNSGAIISQVDATISPYPFYRNKPFDIPAGTDEIWIQDYLDDPYYDFIGFMFSDEYVPVRQYFDDITREINPWKNKTWYGYGTSLTDTSTLGKYPIYLAQMSGLDFVNKGIAGGGIGNLGAYSTGQVYDAICNVTDGKLNADIITLETGANDIAADVPLGNIFDTGRSTLCGCLNDCLRYLQRYTDAQIVVFASPSFYESPVTLFQKYETWCMMIEQICDINRVHFVNANSNMGYGKLRGASKSLYLVDNIHQTDLGGYIYAENIWKQLRNVPPFYTVMP